MNIGLDLDGVVYPWHESLFRHFVETKDYTGTRREFWIWFMSQDRDFCDYYVRLPFLYNNTSPTYGVIEYLPKIAELSTIYYITARPEEAKFSTQKFFDFYDLPFKENVIFTKDKANYVRLLGIDLFLDDRDKEVTALQGLCDVRLFKQVHNWEYRDKFNLINSFKEFYELVKEKNGKKEDNNG